MLNKNWSALRIVLFLMVSLAHAQSVTPSVSNILRYGNGERGTAGFSQPFTYFENLTDVRLSFHSSVTVGFRLLVDDPPEIGEKFQGLHSGYYIF